MSKRIIRIAGNRLRPQLLQLTGQMLNVVQQDGLTYYGQLVQIEKDGFTISDQRNHLHHFVDAELYEIVLDQKAAF
ncbi:hypothetical protein CLV98_10826 [Dyadobacter jejuensis]|uniref:Rho-binding antiterminator n=1 Tax=Dyadobacter jejuensis TaxID=1082580 RepID=A0A316AH34_9BACT|nr:hypothetical protein [Dyadobacter jejuensis]PWJ57106.1 hypothetical protein CLV98_10826 [Dyadobacter jejuensis]